MTVRQTESNTVSNSSPTIETPVNDDHHPWLHRIALGIVFCTFVLIIAGGTVTTNEYGLAVPDWPTSFGKWFLIPLHFWKQSPVFWEHNHRLIGSLVGLLSIAIAMGIWVFEERGWVKALSIALLLLIIVQGLMGGFRVTTETEYNMASWVPLTLRIIHGITGQLVLALSVMLAVALGRHWKAVGPTRDEAGQIRPSVMTVDKIAIGVLLAVLVLQLTLGALVRHNGAGLAIPDFPLSYGQLVPPMTQAKVDAAVANLPKGYHRVGKNVPVGNVHLHFTHRLGAFLVLGVGIWVMSRVAVMLRRNADKAIRNAAIWFAVLLVLQITLGVMVIWTGRDEEVTTGHQTVGAALLGVAMLLSARVWRQGWVCEYPYKPSIKADETNEAGVATAPAAG